MIQKKKIYVIVNQQKFYILNKIFGFLCFFQFRELIFHSTYFQVQGGGGRVPPLELGARQTDKQLHDFYKIYIHI